MKGVGYYNKHYIARTHTHTHNLYNFPQYTQNLHILPKFSNNTPIISFARRPEASSHEEKRPGPPHPPGKKGRGALNLWDFSQKPFLKKKMKFISKGIFLYNIFPQPKKIRMLKSINTVWRLPIHISFFKNIQQTHF